MAGTKKGQVDTSETDAARLRSFTDGEIERIAEEDEECPATDEAFWANATAVLPPMKTPVNAKFDSDIVHWFKAQGRGYQTRMNAVLRQYMEAQRKAG